MRTRISTASATLLLAASGFGQINQVTIPAHFSIYNGYSRGYNFTAATSFRIAELGLPTDAYQAGDTASYLVRQNGVVTLHSVGNAGAICPNILVNSGDVVDVIGNWSPAAAADFTAHNSYTAAVAPYATTIEGVAHTLNRTGWQWDVGVSPLAGVYLTPGAGQIGRVVMSTTAATGLFANFAATPTSGSSPLAVQFTDCSFTSDPGGVQGWAWDFQNDGIVDSLVQNPLHTYTSCGSYSVRLVVTDLANPAAQIVKTGVINVDPVTASFTVAFLGAPNIYQFTDTSTGNPTSWAWDFDNNGVVDSTVQNPVYLAPGACSQTTVRLDAANACVSGSRTRLTMLAPNTFVGTVAGGNGTSSATWLGNHFDVVVTAPEGINVCGLQVTPDTFTGPFNLEVYVTDSTHVGKNTTAAAWRLAGTGTGSSLGGIFTAPTPVDVILAAPFYLPSGNSGLAVYIDNPAGTANLTYTNGPALSPYVGADVTIHPSGVGVSQTALFSGTTFTPRLWNGGFHYTKCSQSLDPGFGFYGPGCAGLLGIPGLDAQNAPQISSTFLVDVTNVPGGPAGLTFMVLGLSRTASLFGPLPFDGTVFGAPGCFLRASTDATTLLLGGPTTTWSLVIPNASNLLCLQFYTQALVASPGTNTLGWVASDAYAGILGQ